MIVDCNGLQSDGYTKNVMDISRLSDKFSSFGFDTDVVDGHDVDALATVLQKNGGKPHAIIAQTVKGRGLSFVENNPKWHHGVLTQALYDQAKKELE